MRVQGRSGRRRRGTAPPGPAPPTTSATGLRYVLWRWEVREGESLLANRVIIALHVQVFSGLCRVGYVKGVSLRFEILLSLCSVAICYPLNTRAREMTVYNFWSLVMYAIYITCQIFIRKKSVLQITTVNSHLVMINTSYHLTYVT